MSNKLLIVLSHSPYGSSLAKEAIDAALAAAVFEQKVQLYFTGEAVWQLLKQQTVDRSTQKSIEANLQALPLYDVDEIYVDNSALSSRAISLEQLNIEAQPVDRAAIQQIIANSDTVLSF
ncbi:Protein TusC [Sinobacterium norvegicum]|uniref:Protein TusC n=1 Tax=Sinobacterium norvegicum TaxID=1641715 RepID=A0ABN8EC81_9GAMM|nr:sulfurtransferase complex subunit TusC [Sinobacterium norvegicum]CAH0990110.1 Protein TusC [Sinobacterium norvegicum]